MATPGEQAALEYGGTTVRNMLLWAETAAQEYWYYIVGAVVFLFLFWRYLRK